ncbi:VF530 family protein [Sphingobacterium corticibacterium]|uniref:DUF2132 domain-containing protein n=1 Tax=Sphingobacterium corticibacterium TaxID=2484746 RepID=A0A4Q6XVK2_9SPHI|nr:VF530 family protein [Sphingobacterium corticibacterium]RZF61414.1 DUF2132 domain-containing protein [Sphingobacterium corticibacterium]
MEKQPNNPLHGKRLDTIIEELLTYYGGWKALSQEIRINCFVDNPSLKSSLTFLRKTPWARKKVEDLYLATFPEQ